MAHTPRVIGGAVVPIEVVAFGLVPGIGSMVSWSEKLDGRLAQAVCSIQSVKGVSLGEGWEVAGKPGFPSPPMPGDVARWIEVELR